MNHLQRILLVIDVYPPAHIGGATLYTVQLAEQLVDMGFAVDVVCAGSWEEGPSHFNGITRDVHNGVTIHRIHLNWRKAKAPFDSLYDNQTLAPIFRELLATLQPEIVHVHSCLTLSARIIQEAKEIGIPVVLHLHQFWFLCALQNLVRKNGDVCLGPESAAACQACVLDGADPWRWSGQLLPEGVRSFLFSKAGGIPILTRQPGLIGMLGNMERRLSYLKETLAAVDIAVAPAKSLIDLFAQYGFRTDHMIYAIQGFDVDWAELVERKPTERLHFGYIGHLQHIKGLHILVEAFRNIPTSIPASLFIHGDPAQQPQYVQPLQAMSTANIYWQGPFERNQLPVVLSNLDVVVVPSLSFEVNPTVIKEAFAAGVPVIVSDQPGVCETVEQERSGLHFQTGDANSLREQILRLAHDRPLLERLRQGVPAVKTIAESAQEMVEIYSVILSQNQTVSVKKQL